jgi:hypothetical protein
VRLLLSWILGQQAKRLAPTWDREKNRHEYVEVKRLTATDDSRDFLERLASVGLFRRSLFTVEVACPKCGSLSFRIDYACPYCESRKLQKGTMIEHFDCRFLDFMEKFQEGTNLVCPKCRKPLRLVGVDYRKIESVFKCLDCRQSFSLPKISLVSDPCGERLNYDEVLLRPVYTYEFNDALESEVAKYCITQSPLMDFLLSFDFSVESPKALVGDSGVYQVFDVHAKRGEQEIVFDIERSNKEIDYTAVLKFHTKVFDSHPKTAVLIAIPGLTPQAKKLAETYKISVVEGKSGEDVVAKLHSLLPSLLSERDSALRDLMKKLEDLQ